MNMHTDNLMHTYICVHIYIYVYTCIYICMYLHMYIYAYILCRCFIFCMSTKILWGGRWQDETGAGSGEDMEQLFSYLSKWGFTTRNMLAYSKIEWYLMCVHIHAFNSYKCRKRGVFN